MIFQWLAATQFYPSHWLSYFRRLSVTYQHETAHSHKLQQFEKLHQDVHSHHLRLLWLSYHKFCFDRRWRMETATWHTILDRVLCKFLHSQERRELTKPNRYENEWMLNNLIFSYSVKSNKNQETNHVKFTEVTSRISWISIIYKTLSGNIQMFWHFTFPVFFNVEHFKSC